MAKMSPTTPKGMQHKIVATIDGKSQLFGFKGGMSYSRLSYGGRGGIGVSW